MSAQMVDGALLLDKPVGLTSNRVLQEAKKLLAAKKAGHGGTLDPLARGVLVLCVGHATRLTEYVQDMGKTYVALAVVALIRHFHPKTRLLVIAPRENIQRKWQREQPRWQPTDFQ